jgi:HlyD family secretion protein
VSATLDANINLSASQLAGDKANVSAGLTEVNAAISTFNTISQNIAQQQAAVNQAQAALTLTQAGATPEAIAAQEAVVEQAKAGVASAEANLQNSEIVSPISGTVTQQDAKIGQQATPGTPLVSVIGTGGFEVDAGVSETDVGKLAMGDSVTMTLDAFPNETFTGSVFYIAPAETNTGGVITYLIKIAFSKADPRLKSGLTANVDIQTKHDDTAFILPQYAILQNDSGTFVETLVGGVTTTTPVTLGIQDQSGNVEVLSGVTLGEQVINIGLKTP